MIHVLEHSLLESLKVFVVILVFYILFSFFETKLASLLTKNKKLSPLLGAIFGLIPQCGFPILAADLYIKKHISFGTLLSVFIACSDESLPILISSIKDHKYIILLIVIKFVLAVLVGYIFDLISSKSKQEVHDHHHHCHHQEEVHVGCCNHSINDNKESHLKKHLLHPLIHSLKIFIFIFIINFTLGSLIHFIGEDNLSTFITSSYYLTPLFSTLIGLIPNCVSSVILTNLFILGSIPFGGLLGGLIINSGLGSIYLLKNKESRVDYIKITSILVIISLVIGYLFILF